MVASTGWAWMSDFVLLRQFVTEANELYERATRLERECESLRNDVRNLRKERDSWLGVSEKQSEEIDKLNDELEKFRNG